MELKEYIQSELNGQKRTTGRVLKELKQGEYEWRPACGCNSIGLILFHISRSEDQFLSKILGKPQLWDTEKWYDKLKTSQTEAGSHYTADQVNAFPCPDGGNLAAYFEAARGRTGDALSAMSAADLGQKITVTPFPGETTVAAMFSLIVNHAAGHFGEMAYVRGIQRGLDK
jgi:uncharacterized damage-inducible protein DinB